MRVEALIGPRRSSALCLNWIKLTADHGVETIERAAFLNHYIEHATQVIGVLELDWHEAIESGRTPDRPFGRGSSRREPQRNSWLLNRLGKHSHIISAKCRTGMCDWFA